MNRRSSILLAGVLCLAAAGLGGVRLFDGARAGSIPDGALSRPASAPRATDRTIALAQSRIRTDPYSAGDQSWLATLLLQRARETGEHQDVLRAEQAARESLRLRDVHNETGYAVLAASLMEQHRYAEALEIAEGLAAADPENPSYRAMLAEVQLELGDYAAAAATFGSLAGSRSRLDVAPRLARWAEVSGRTDEARQLLYAARDQAAVRTDLPPEQRAWFHLRVGDLELSTGRLDRAAEAFRSGLEIHPGDYRLLAAMARLEAARGRWSAALDYGERVIALNPDPGTLALMSDVHAASGDREQARAYARAVEVAVSGKPGAFHRAEGLFLLDHGIRVEEVLARAEQDVRTRRDVYGYDLLAWALHRAGRHADAARAMRMALRTGSENPLLLYHAGMIERAAGRTAEARRHLERALELNPRFHVTGAPVARAALDSIRGGRGWLPFRSPTSRS